MTQPESQDARSTRKRTRSPLNSKLDKSLWAYAAAASAAGVGILAAPAAEAKIVYTPVNVSFVGAPYKLDLNQDGVVDFYLVPGKGASVGGSARASYLDVCHMDACAYSSSSPNKDNTVRITSAAAALPAGAKIANGEKFAAQGFAAFMVAREYYSRSSNTAQFWKGPWANGGKGSTNRYLGFKFKIDGQFHYGWARLSVSTPAHGPYKATLTGYAYETIPNKGIVAGQESGPAEIGDNINDTNPTRSFRPASLGLLGLGATGLVFWRRKKEDSQDQALETRIDSAL
jgi:hypothetical protein